MADAAAFFANKKKKKKAFKFNANKIDASTVTQTVHVDAPALSNAAAPEASPAAAFVENPAVQEANDAGEQWDDEALAATLTRKGPVASSGATTELLDMKALDLKSNEQDDIQEKLRVEETKAKLAAAREGMEKEAQRIKEEREKKESGAANAAPRFGAAAAGMGMGGGKWVPRHMRAGGMMASRLPGASAKVDTQDENLFPDLAAADAIIEQQKQNGPMYKAPKKTPVGGGATWGDRPKLNLERKKNAEKPPETKPEKSAPAAAPAVSEPAKEEAPEPKAPEPAAAPPAAAPKQPIKPKKKKKKDLSTFKA
mmetsp:Transcript_124758/g.186359  ORF Transcript_124758/g.186359 Transcript_124758/m.186359 type:complete len:312 (+) Transcript_124758:54-989(+)|eukprot:CAMPEP_0117051550 /NCGR_PEP_ID=MMETSP0472-20121206/35608_1 /TAXON_ID=693140 ORGANISM="Tiarina fusus, Strain LIS" /NCGR_SAMPLE_ID=MMETSP0472 /ASSEMBLY_ACC=CAM_ASM_000603 /LENGTH=311 /DNA_ID=CAMNT_0004765787 /DNA_START=44 /DNA_END=979 /DNA_ORIENTATION=+